MMTTTMAIFAHAGTTAIHTKKPPAVRARWGGAGGRRAAGASSSSSPSRIRHRACPPLLVPGNFHGHDFGGRGGSGAAAPVVWRATSGGDEVADESKDTRADSDGKEGGEEKKKKEQTDGVDGESEASGDSPQARPQYRGIDLKGGQLGYGETVDKALDATTNPDLFILGAGLLTIGAVLAFLFGPRPPSDYYG